MPRELLCRKRRTYMKKEETRELICGTREMAREADMIWIRMKVRS